MKDKKRNWYWVYVCGAYLVIILLSAALVESDIYEKFLKQALAPSEIKVVVYVDPETGVNYLIYNGPYKSGMCPRYNADGSLYLEEDKIED